MFCMPLSLSLPPPDSPSMTLAFHRAVLVLQGPHILILYEIKSGYLESTIGGAELEQSRRSL